MAFSFNYCFLLILKLNSQHFLWVTFEFSFEHCYSSTLTLYPWSLCGWTAGLWHPWPAGQWIVSKPQSEPEHMGDQMDKSLHPVPLPLSLQCTDLFHLSKENSQIHVNNLNFTHQEKISLIGITGWFVHCPENNKSFQF